MEFVVNDEETGMAIEQADCHVEWQDSCEMHDRVLLFAHRESGKTNQISIGRPLFRLGKNRDLRIALVSNTYHQAEKNVRTVAGYIERSARLHAVFPDLVPGEPWTSSQITVRSDNLKRDPSLQAVGVHGNILGARLDEVIFDDILDFENTQTPRLRQDLWDWIHATIMGMLTRDAKFIIVGTPWNPDDALHRFARQPIWQVLTYPVADTNGQPLWPDRWPKDRIESKRLELGPLEFARQMMCQARDDSQARFSSTWIDKCLEAGAFCQVADSALDFYEKHPELAPPDWASEERESESEIARALDSLRRMGVGYGCFLTGVDLGVQLHSAADETVLFTIFLHEDGQRQVVDIDAGRWPGPVIVSKIWTKHQRFGSLVIVENNSAQDFILQFTVQQGVIPIVPFTTGRNKSDPVMGVEAIAAEVANVAWLIPECRGAAGYETNREVDRGDVVL
jgi:hypothetical protein